MLTRKLEASLHILLLADQSHLEDAFHTWLAEVVTAWRGEGLLQDSTAQLALEFLQRLLMLRQLQHSSLRLDIGQQ